MFQLRCGCNQGSDGKDCFFRSYSCVCQYVCLQALTLPLTSSVQDNSTYIWLSYSLYQAFFRWQQCWPLFVLVPVTPDDPSFMITCLCFMLFYKWHLLHFLRRVIFYISLWIRMSAATIIYKLHLLHFPVNVFLGLFICYQCHLLSL